MPPARKKTTRKTARSAPSKRQGEASLARLEKSLEVAQKAVEDLRKNLTRGGRDLVKDVHKMVGEARRDTRRLNKAVHADLEQLGGAIARRSRAATGRGTTKKSVRRPATKGTSRPAASKRSKAKKAR